MSTKRTAIDSLMNFIWGFADPQVIKVAKELEVFKKLPTDKTVNLKTAMRLLEMEERPARALLSYLIALGLVEGSNGTYRNSSNIEKILKNSPQTWKLMDGGYFGSARLMKLFKFLWENGVIDLENASQLLGMNREESEKLFAYCKQLGLLNSSNGTYCNSPELQDLTEKGAIDSLLSIATMWDLRLEPAWHNLKKALLENRPQTWDPGNGHFETIHSGKEALKMFYAGMDGMGTLTARALVTVLDLSSFSRLLDVGGGTGGYSIELLRNLPKLRGGIFDLPTLQEAAREQVEVTKMTDRIKILSGDFFESLPEGFDVHLFSMIFHDWSPLQIEEILENSFKSLRPSGIIIISEQMLEDDETGPLGAVRMGMNMLIENYGFNYTWGEYEEWMRKVGFIVIPRIHISGAPGANGVIIGAKP